MRGLLRTFSEAFDEADFYSSRPPSNSYLERLLGTAHFIALVALKQGRVVGGLTAYELIKYEQERSELYIYDLAVAAAHRRQGVATALIERTTDIAAKRGAWVVFIQADTGVEDEPAIALYSKLGTREEVLHFDIPVAHANR